MIEQLYNPNTYPRPVAEQVEQMGAVAVSIANRWLLGWPKHVESLLKAGTYLDSLSLQVDQEKQILANEANLRHLAPREILEFYGISESPPA